MQVSKSQRLNKHYYEVPKKHIVNMQALISIIIKYKKMHINTESEIHWVISCAG